MTREQVIGTFKSTKPKENDNIVIFLLNFSYIIGPEEEKNKI